MEMANEYSCCDDWQDNSTAEDIARAQGCTDVADLLSKLTSVSCVHFPSFYSVYFLNNYMVPHADRQIRYHYTPLPYSGPRAECLSVCLSV